MVCDDLALGQFVKNWSPDILNKKNYNMCYML